MTFCLGMKVSDGLVGIADTRITSGNECITARKVKVYQREGHSIFMMTSGLRSVRDKALTYFDEMMEQEPTQPFNRMYKVVNAMAQQIRRVAEEDKKSLEEAGLRFNIHCLVGGQLVDDREHKLYQLYPEGNWIEITPGTPYYIIGSSGYGKPVLDRTFKYDDSMRVALKVGCLAFDSTRISAADVDFPIDLVLYARDSFQIIEQRYTKDDLQPMYTWWQDALRRSLHDLPSDALEDALETLPTLPREPLAKIDGRAAVGD